MVGREVAGGGWEEGMRWRETVLFPLPVPGDKKDKAASGKGQGRGQRCTLDWEFSLVWISLQCRR